MSGEVTSLSSYVSGKKILIEEVDKENTTLSTLTKHRQSKAASIQSRTKLFLQENAFSQ